MKKCEGRGRDKIKLGVPRSFPEYELGDKKERGT